MKTLQSIVDRGKRIVFFGGAGVSTESGIPDFRSVDGLYHQTYDVPPEILLSHTYFECYPEKFYRFYREKMLFPDAQPNAAHRALYALEKAGKLQGIVTQNIDGLHQKAGNRKVYELHGSVRRNACMHCGRNYPLSYILATSGVPHCDCGGVIKPDVVLYEEPLDPATMRGAQRVMNEADVLIVAGTSLAVYPAAGMIDDFHGSELVLINRTPTPADAKATLIIRENVGEVMAALLIHYD